jgi:hypothetical protein
LGANQNNNQGAAMKLTIFGDIAKARLDGLTRVNEKAGNAMREFIPLGLEPLYAERHKQAKGGGGRMVADYAEVHGVTNKQALDAIKAEAETIEVATANIEKARQSAMVAINAATTVSEIDAIIEGMSSNA